MTFLVKNITLKNFLSVGNQTQAVDFNKEHLVLVLGENIDLGGDDSGSRNGTGKTTIINALSYALYGQALTNIRKENLINKTNGKNMLVTTEFELSGINYRIERGRKPNILKLYINNEEQKVKDQEDDAQGDSRETQKHIDLLLGMSHTMFKHLVALNTYTDPFLSLKAADQRDVIEQLLGITLLSEKAEKLKLLIKTTKDDLQAETFRIDGVRAANKNVQNSIDSLQLKSSTWDSKKEQDLENLSISIGKLCTVDIDDELKLHSELKKWKEEDSKRRDLTRQKITLESAVDQAERSVQKYLRELATLETKMCPACEQEIHDHKHEQMLEKIQKDLAESEAYKSKVRESLQTVVNELSSLSSTPRPEEPFYDTETEALGHKNNLENLETSLENKFNEVNPFNEQIEELTKTALQEVTWDTVNKLTKLREHQEFLLKLLTNKDSFIRKKIIDQNLSYLNKRLSYYIEKLGLPHVVVFKNDLNVEITQLGQELDFDNLSRGERNRLILSLSFAFRDVWENLYQHINILFVDELIDSGMDPAGVEAGLAVLKKMARERSKNIFLISHKDELIGRVNTVLHVKKEGGFTSYEKSTEVV